MKKKEKVLTRKKKLEQALILAKGQKKVELHEKLIKGDV